ncbi:helix-turn-helix domain-containing protein [Qipengyuania marisflavi]|nr:helix-turn-helix domain-containing protein [Qipengyuania marisflavi]
MIANDYTVKIPDLANELGVSQRTLQRAFGRRYGMSPLKYTKLVRTFRSMVGHDYPTLRWANVPAEIDYVDQSHWIRDVRRLYGLAPGQLGANEEYHWLYYPRGSLEEKTASEDMDGLTDWREFAAASRLVDDPDD